MNNLKKSIWKNSHILQEKKIFLNKFMSNNFIGGSNKKLKIKYNNKTYIYNEVMDDNYYILYSYDDFECVSILIDNEEKIAEIHGIGNYKTCINEVNSNVGSTLLKITLKMLKKYKDKLNINKILITDNSIKKCNDKNIILSVMLILLTGDTWYGKYNFIPVYKLLVKYYENNKKIMNTIKLKDIDLIKYLQMTQLNKKIIKKSKKFIANHQELLLKDYLTKFLEKYDNTCEYFHDFYFTLFIDLQLYDFNKRIFELKL